MREIQGDKYKLAGITVQVQGTLVDVFAKFAGVNENVDDILANKREKSTKPEAKPGTLGALLDSIEPLPREFLMPSLSVEDITNALLGARDLRGNSHGLPEIHITDTPGVIADLGPEKLAQVLVEMGQAKREALSQGFQTFIKATPAKAPTP
ncbi:MAG: hypothetical protein K0R10_2121 [Alphaproteobacteria bacterium]|jgi:hypothetical protein|nr:hypothetical protein [Alphaproteobacteria bacterium]